MTWVTGSSVVFFNRFRIVASTLSRVRRVEDLMGMPVEIEWAMDEAGFKLLQSRPLYIDMAESESVKRATAQSAAPLSEVMTATRDQLICDSGGTCTLIPPFEYSVGYFNGVSDYSWSWGGPPEALHDFHSYPYGSAPIEAGSGPILRPYGARRRLASAPSLAAGGSSS